MQDTQLTSLIIAPSPVAAADANYYAVTGIKRYSVAVDPPNQAAAGFFGVDVAVTGVAVGDVVYGIVPPATLEANLKPVGAVVTAANTVRLTLQALAAVDGASLTWVFYIASLRAAQ